MACSVQHSCNNLMTFNFHVKTVLGTSKRKFRNSIIYNHYRTTCTCDLIHVYLLVTELKSALEMECNRPETAFSILFRKKGLFINVTFYI